MMGLLPDYVMILVGANMGLSAMTKEHIGIVLSLLLVGGYLEFYMIELAQQEGFKMPGF